MQSLTWSSQTRRWRGGSSSKAAKDRLRRSDYGKLFWPWYIRQHLAVMILPSQMSFRLSHFGVWATFHWVQIWNVAHLGSILSAIAPLVVVVSLVKSPGTILELFRTSGIRRWLAASVISWHPCRHMRITTTTNREKIFKNICGYPCNAGNMGIVPCAVQ